MKKIAYIILAAVSLTACSNFGKKVEVPGTKAEVFYKGDGVTEEDAKKTGEFLKESFFSADKKASVQLTREGEEYTIRFVYDKTVFDTLKGIEDIFKEVGIKASKQLFDGKKVNIALANSSFKDYKTILYDEAMAKRLEAPPATDETTISKADFDHDSAGGVDFYWKGISDEESKMIADYIVQNGSFNGGRAEIYMTKSGDRFTLRFPVIESARNDASFVTDLEKVTKQIKDNVFANVPYSFYMTDENMNTVKAWDY
ncbi:MAG: hypothetical protein SGI83_11970 [Bacteroidota bacterium]|nr:hypothetical protein [Bacteroidota bacterium]